MAADYRLAFQNGRVVEASACAGVDPKNRIAGWYGCISPLRYRSIAVITQKEYGDGGILRHVFLPHLGNRSVTDSVETLAPWAVMMVACSRSWFKIY